jgi:hypothetical protein
MSNTLLSTKDLDTLVPWLTAKVYLCHKWPRICSICRKHFPVLSSFMTYRRFVTRIKRRVPLVEQELLTLSDHTNSPRFLVGFVILVLLVLCVCFVDRCLYFCAFSFVHCVVCSSSIYRFWLFLWYLQTLLTSSKAYGGELFIARMFIRYYYYLINLIIFAYYME